MIQVRVPANAVIGEKRVNGIRKISKKMATKNIEGTLYAYPKKT
jgi:hypothetical protein